VEYSVEAGGDLGRDRDGIICFFFSIFLSIWFQVMASFLESLYMSDQSGECCTFLRNVSLISRTVVVRIASMLLQRSVSILSGLVAVVSSSSSACSCGSLSKEERTFFLNFFTLTVAVVHSEGSLRGGCWIGELFVKDGSVEVYI
jgi:hypothetical protein